MNFDTIKNKLVGYLKEIYLEMFSICQGILLLATLLVTVDGIIPNLEEDDALFVTKEFLAILGK